MIGIAVATAVLALIVFDSLFEPRFLRQSEALTFGFAYGCLVNGILTIAWRGPPWWARLTAIGGGGAIELIATAYLGIRFGTLPMLLWCLFVHHQARRHGWA